MFSMYILGIHDRHNATACLLKDGKIIAAVSEERFTRIKNQSGFPFLAVKYCLEFAKIKGKDIDLLVFSNNSPLSFLSTIFIARVSKKASVSNRIKLLSPSYYHLHTFLLYFEYLLLQTRIFKPLRNSSFYRSTISRLQNKGHQIIYRKTGIHPSKYTEIDHHLAHAYATIYSSSFPKHKKESLIFTCDGCGDGLSATVNLYKEGRIIRVAKANAVNSLGAFYAFITSFLGMKPLEHEYKVMGLAPYSPDFGKNLAYPILKPLVSLDKKRLAFKTKFSSELFGNYFQKKLKQIRFDFVAAAAQQITEDLLAEWVQESVRKFNISNIACGGGVFMNVKANQKVAELPEVKEVFFMPSGGDESNAVGAAYWGFTKLSSSIPSSLTNLYLGPQYSRADIQKAFQKRETKTKYKVESFSQIEKKIAKLLAAGEIVARVNERMEWGARALGNRSILADASKPGVIEILNKMIKSRDFWMPFAPIFLREFESEYILNPKKIEAPFMIITFDSKPKAQEDLRAAMHPYDKTLRPQIVDKKANLSYFKLLTEFRKLTGKSGILNTSFNIHGDPIVCSPEDALLTFENTGLKYLAMGNFLVSKN